MRRTVNACRVIAVCLLLTGCSWFGGNDDDSTDPVKLGPIEAEITLAPLWDRNIGGAARDRASRLVPALVSGRIFAASADGNIVAMQPGSGRVIWQVDVRDFYTDEELETAFAKKSDAITGGVGGGGDLVVVGTFAGDLVALNQSDGSLAWKARTTSEVLAPPQVHRDMVVAQSIDGKVAVYDTLDGERRWIYTSSVPSLTLRGTTTPVVTDEFIATGFANGRIVILDPERGIAGLDERIAIPQGKSDLERLVDIDGRMVMVDSKLFVVGYQGNLAAIDLQSGRLAWSKEASSIVGLGAGFGNVYLAAADGVIRAFDADSGREVWSTEKLKYRDLTAPVAISSFIAVGDLEGYIHLIAQADGRFVGRRRVHNDPLRSPFVVDGSRIYVMTNSGRLMAFELR